MEKSVTKGNSGTNVLKGRRILYNEYFRFSCTGILKKGFPCI